jgi:hypothetical protein
MEHKQDMETPIAEEGLRDDAHTAPWFGVQFHWTPHWV